MKKTLLLAFICIVVFALPLSAAENFANGFRGIPWKASAPQDDGSGSNKLELCDVGRHLSEKRYERYNEDFSFAGAKVIFIEYLFQDSLGFAKVEITFRGIENYKLLRRACFENWGQPVSGYIDGRLSDPDELINEKEDLSISNYTIIENSWEGKDIFIHLEHNNTGKKNGTMSVCLEDYYTMLAIDNANNYPKENEELNSFLEEMGLL